MRAAVKQVAIGVVGDWIRSVLHQQAPLADLWNCNSWGQGAKNHLVFRCFKNAAHKLMLWQQHDETFAAMKVYLQARGEGLREVKRRTLRSPEHRCH